MFYHSEWWNVINGDSNDQAGINSCMMLCVMNWDEHGRTRKNLTLNAHILIIQWKDSEGNLASPLHTDSPFLYYLVQEDE